ncbi:MAG: hypothetical protein AABX28_03190 [Nanoarchaeota archaeon]|mgnify:CR=1 FL=1
MGREEASFLIQLVDSLKESELKMEEYYEKKDYDDFNKVKKLMLTIQKNISEVANDV